VIEIFKYIHTFILVVYTMREIMKEGCINHSNSSGNFKFLYIIFFLSLFAISPIFADTLTTCKTSGWVSGTTYYLTGPVSSSGTCMNIDVNNITLDCQGNTITYATSSQGYGFYLNAVNYTTIRNCKIQANTGFSYSYGIFIQNGQPSFNLIENNTINITNPSSTGIFFNSGGSITYNNTVKNNTIQVNGDYPALYLSWRTDNSFVYNNRIINTYSTGQGIGFISGQNNLIYNNFINASTPVNQSSTWLNIWNTTKCSFSPNIVGGQCVGGNFYATPSGTGFSETCTDSDGDGICNSPSNYTINSVNIDYLPLSLPPIELTSCGTLNQTGRYYKLTSNVSSSGTCFTIAANNVTLDCQGYTITYGQTTNYSYGIYSLGYNYTNIKNCKLVQNTTGRGYVHGIYFAGSSNNKVENVSISVIGNYSSGIFLSYSWPNSANYNFIKNVSINMTGVQGYGLQLYGSSYNNFTNISILTSGYLGYGVYLSPSSTNTNNSFTNMSVTSLGSNSNALFLNGDNNIFFNNIFNSTYPVYISSGSNSFNTTLIPGQNIVNGPYIGGNFWATPSGTGFSQTCSDSNNDGICDTNYTINSNNIDYLPLAVPPTPLSSCGTISSPGKYILTQNVSSSGTCFTIAANNVTLDCQGYTINHTGNQPGIQAQYYNFTTIKDCNVIGDKSSGNVGLFINSTINVSVFNNNISSHYYGIDIRNSSFITISQNSIRNNIVHGFFAAFSNSITLINNSITSSSNGVVTSFTNYTLISNNIISNNSDKGIDLESSYNSTIINNSIYTNSKGAYLYASNNNSIVFNNFTSNNYGVYLEFGSKNNQILNNNFSFNSLYGLYDNYGDYLVFSNNLLTNNTNGIYLGYALYAYLSNNTVNSINIDFSSDFNLGNVVVNLTFNSSTYPTTASFTYSGSINIVSANAIPSPGLLNVSKYLNISNTTSSATWVSINISYSNDTIGTNETKLKLYKYNETAGQWQEVPGSGVDTSSKIVFGTINSFSIFAPLAIADASPPSISLISSANDTYTNNDYMTFSFNATDDQSTTLNCSLYINNILNQTNSSVVNGSITSFALTGIADGDYSWYINCSDASGNSNVSQIRTFTIDKYSPFYPPYCTSLSSSGSEYRLTRNVYATGTCFQIATGVTLDCQGHSINYASSATGYGVNGINVSNAIIKNCIIQQTNSSISNTNGIYLYNSSYSIIQNNTINASGPGSNAINLDTGYGYNNITDNNITYANAASLRLNGISNNNIISNDFRGGSATAALYVLSSSYNYFDYNWINGSYGDAYVKYSQRNTFIHNDFIGTGVNLDQTSNNTFNLNYFNVSGSGSGCKALTLYASPDTLISNNNMYAMCYLGTAVYLSGSASQPGIKIIFNNISAYIGLSVNPDGYYNTHYVNISNNVISGYSQPAIALTTTHDNIVQYNVITNPRGNGIELANGAYYNNIAWNNISTDLSYGGAGIRSYGGVHNNSFIYNNINARKGISLDSSYYNQIGWNNITSSDQEGIYIISSSYLNNISNNKISSNTSIGVNLDGSSGTVYNNTFMFNNISSNSYTVQLYQNAVNNSFSQNNMTSTSSSVPAVFIRGSSNLNIFANNMITSSNHNGVNIYSSSNNALINNRIAAFYSGLYLTSNSNNNNFTNNNITSQRDKSVYLNAGSNNLFSNNVMNTSYTGISGVYIENYSKSNLFINNTIDNKGVTGGLIIFSSSDNNQFINNTLTSTTLGAWIVTDYNAFITNSITSSNNYAVYLYGGLYNNLTNNLITSINNSSIYILSGGNNRFTNNIINSVNYIDFISTSSSSGNTIVNMTFNGSSYPTTASFTYDGDINVDSADAIQSPGLLNVSKYLNISTPSSASVNMNISYTDQTNETKLRMYRFNGTNWLFVDGSNVNTDYDYVYATITSFSTFAPLIDLISPAVSISSPSSNVFLNSKTITISGSSVDDYLNYTNISIYNASGLINSTITTDSSWSVQLSVPSDGVYNITATAYDKSDNSNSSTITNITVDSTNPSLSINSPSSNVFLNSKTISINLTVSDVNLNYTNISILQGSTIINSTITSASGTFIVTLSVPNDGVYNITATTYDKSNNQNSASITNITVDSTNPSLTINYPSSNVFLNSKTISINLTVSDVNLNYTNISILQGSTIINSTITSSSGTFVVSLSVPSDGVYNISVVTKDKANNQNSASITNITVDSTNPSLTINYPSSNVFLNSKTISINLTVSDVNLNYTNISILQGSTIINSTITSSSGTFVVSLSVPSDGVYNITATTYDLAGNSNTSAATNITVDTIYPLVSIVSPKQTSPIFIRSDVPVNVEFNYTEVNQLNYTLYLVNSSGEVVSTKTGSLSIGGENISVSNSLATTGLENGNYSVNVSVYDAAGHQTMVQEQNNVIIDNSIPGVIINSPSSSEYIIGDTILLNLTIFDENLNYTNISIYNSTGFVLSYITLQSGTFTINFTLPDDMYFINVTSYDLSGNNASNSISNVELDSTSPFYPTKCLTILLPGEYYLSSNLNSNDTTCIEIDSDNVLLDGQGHEVHNLGNAEVPGILVEDQTNITIQNIIISHYVPDIKMVNVTGAKIHNVTHNGGQLDLISSRDINVSDSSFENSTVEGMIINNSDSILIYSTSIRNSQNDNVVLLNSNASFINSTITNNAVNSSGFKLIGTGSIEIFNSSISVPLNSLAIDAGGSSNLNISVSDSNIQNSTNVIFLADTSSDFQSRNIYLNLWKNNIGSFTKAILASDQINGSGRILLNNDFYGNYWGSSVYPYLNTSSQLENVFGVNDNYPYKEMNGWNKEKRFWLSSSEQSILSQDGRLNTTMNSNSIANLVLSRLAGELFIIEDMDPINISGENSLIDAKLHYRFGTYKSIYVPAEVEESKPIISTLPIYFTANLSGLVSQDEQGNVTIVEYDKSKNEWPYIGTRQIPVDSSLKARTKLQAINGSIEFVVGKKIADLILIDNISPTVSLSQSGGLVIANYVDPVLNISQNDNGAGMTEKIISSDQIVPLFTPSGANISFAQLNLSANSGTPSFVFSVYLHTNVTSDSPGVLYYMQNVNSLQPGGMAIDLTSQISNAMSNCSTMHNGSYCMLYLAFNSLNGGSVKLSDISINYSYASGIKLPDKETSSSITSLTEQPNHDSNIAYLSGSGGQDILLLTLPFKAYIKSAQITLVGEQWNSSYPSDVSFWIGNGSTNSHSDSPIMAYNGQFNTSVQIISPFVNALNTYISTHDATEKGEYIIPLTFNSSAKGKVRVSSILIDYDLRNQYDTSSPSYMDGFSDGRESFELEFTPSQTSHILYIDVPKYAKVSNITISVSPSESITFDIDFLNDGQVEIQNSTQVQPVNLTSYLDSCTPTKFMIPYGRTCRIPINVTANLDVYSSVNATFESVSEFISPVWRYTGSDSEVVRGSMRKLDFLSLPSLPAKRARSLNLEHHSIYSLQNGDVVIAYAVDMAGNRGSNQFTFTIQQTQSSTRPPFEPLLSKIPLSGFMNCTNSLAYVITEPGASITVLYRSTGQFVTGGTADQNGRFEFTPSITGGYLIRSSKQGFEENSIVLTAISCEIPFSLRAKRVLDCTSGSCIIKLEAQTNKISDFQLKLSDFIPSAVIKTVNSITDRLGSKFLAYGYTDSIISIPPTQTISSTFSVLVDTFLTAVAPEYKSEENKLKFTINNPSEDLSVDEVTIPLPEEARGKEIKSIEYVAADGTKMNITDYVVESDKIVVKQTIPVKKS